LIASIAVAATIGTVYAFDCGPPCNVTNGNIRVDNGDVMIVRNDALTSKIFLKNDNSRATLLTMRNTVADQSYHIRLSADGSQFDWFDQTNSRVDLVIKTADGKIGIGTQNPAEQLDVKGNIKLSGPPGVERTITADGDICIGNCP